jgi:CheY-like chemotaxis protein
LTIPLATDWAQLLLTPIWSAIVALLLFGCVLAFRRPLVGLLGRKGISRLSLFGVDVEWIAGQTADAYRERGLPVPAIEDLRAFGILSAHLAPLVRDRRVLWVDDRPQGNSAEARLLRRLGVEIKGAEATDEALAKIAREPAPFDLVISDWDRGGGDDALELATRMQEGDLELPLIVYAGRRDAERCGRAAEHDIAAVTTEPDDLLKHVLFELALS